MLKLTSMWKHILQCNASLSRVEENLPVETCSKNVRLCVFSLTKAISSRPAALTVLFYHPFNLLQLN